MQHRLSTAAAMLSFVVALPAQSALAAEPAHKSSWEEYQALKAKAGGGTRHTHATLPDWRGVWRRVTPPGQAFSYNTDIGVHPRLGEPYGQTGAQLTPKYAAAYEAKLRNIEKGIEWDRLSYCLPVGMPRWFSSIFLREFIATPEQTWLIHEQMQEIRRIHTDGRDHTADAVAIPLWQGDSIGFWDGDALVVHTKHMKAGEYARGQPDYSFKVTSVERIRKVAPNAIEIVATVYDPDSLLRPFRASFRYEKVADPQVRVNYNSCEEGNNAVRTPEGGTTFILPGEPGYRDPTTIGIPEVALDSLPQ